MYSMGETFSMRPCFHVRPTAASASAYTWSIKMAENHTRSNTWWKRAKVRKGRGE